MTTLYGVARGTPPPFFDGNAQAFSGLMFHLEDETFAFHQPIKMRDDPLWVDVTGFMQKGMGWFGGFGGFNTRFRQHDDDLLDQYFDRLGQLRAILDVELPVEQVTGADKSLDVVVDIFNRVNSGGTKLSKGDLALAKICADWPGAREAMKQSLGEWEERGYSFTLDWLLRSVNTVLTGEAKFSFLHEKTQEEVQDALGRAKRAIDNSLNMIRGGSGSTTTGFFSAGSLCR